MVRTNKVVKVMAWFAVWGLVFVVSLGYNSVLNSKDSYNHILTIVCQNKNFGLFDLIICTIVR